MYKRQDYDYENFSYSSGLDETGYWEGVKALDYVTLPKNFASLTFKRSEIEPTDVYKRQVLVIVEHGDIQLPLQRLFDLKALGALDIQMCIRDRLRSATTAM